MAQNTSESNPRVATNPFLRTAGLAVAVYAIAAGLRTLSDFDFWWQLSAGRWMAEHGEILRQEVFSSTAPGVPWTYPAGGPTIFFALFQVGGFTLVSLLAPLACLLTALILLHRGGATRLWATALAVPAIAWRCAVRADMFTTLLTAAFLALLWQDHLHDRPNRRWLWLLPLLMMFWVNLHPGFLIGVALVAIFAVRHPRRLTPVAVATLLATLANPWGWGIYRWLTSLAAMLPVPQFAQAWIEQSAKLSQDPFIGEFSPTPISGAILGDALRWRDPDSSLWWLAGLALVGVAVALIRGWGMGPLLLIAAAVCAFHASRFQAVFATFAALIVPDLLADRASATDSPPRTSSLWPVLAACLLVPFIGVRVWDLWSNRYYLTHGDIAAFGPGVSSWYPERAVRFIEERKLPRELYNDYNLGGYLTWSGAPDYPVFIDGRGDPYGSDLFFMQRRLGMQGPKSADWQAAIHKWNLHTLIISVARYGGFGGLPIKNFCDSSEFRLVYLDETAAVFSAAGDVKGPALDCHTALLIPPSATASAWDRYQFYANAGKLYYALERDSEADDAWHQADGIFDDDAGLHLDIGQLRHAQGRTAEAEQEFRRALQLRPTPTSWFALGDLEAGQGRHFEAMEAFRQAAERDARPYEDWAAVGQSALAAQRPMIALDAANKALDSSPYQGKYSSLGRGFIARALAIRGAAYLSLRQAPQAVDALEQAVQTAGNTQLAPGLRLALCQAYLAAGRRDDARRTLDEAKKMGAQGDPVNQLETELSGK